MGAQGLRPCLTCTPASSRAPTGPGGGSTQAQHSGRFPEVPKDPTLGSQERSIRTPHHLPPGRYFHQETQHQRTELTHPFRLRISNHEKMQDIKGPQEGTAPHPRPPGKTKLSSRTRPYLPRKQVGRQGGFPAEASADPGLPLPRPALSTTRVKGHVFLALKHQPQAHQPGS